MLRYSFLHKTVLAVFGLVLTFYVIHAELGLTAGPSKHHVHRSSPSKQTACSLKAQASILDT
jgi:hypothetical protein